MTAVRDGFVAAGIPERLVDELLESYEEAKRRFHLRDLRPQEVEGGRFSEAVFRVLQHLCGQQVTPLGKTLPKVDKLLVQSENAAGQPDAVRIHIPRTLKLIYDIRNKRDAAHTDRATKCMDASRRCTENTAYRYTPLSPATNSPPRGDVTSRLAATRGRSRS